MKQSILEEIAGNDPMLAAILETLGASPRRSTLARNLDYLQNIINQTNELMHLDVDDVKRTLEFVRKRHDQSCRHKGDHATCNVAMRMMQDVFGLLYPIILQNRDKWTAMMTEYSELAAQCERQDREARGEIMTTFRTDTQALLIGADNIETVITPKNGTDFSFEELYPQIGCEMIEIVRLPNNMVLLIDEEGRNKGAAQNKKATRLYNNHPEDIRGNAVLCSSDMLK